MRFRGVIAMGVVSVLALGLNGCGQGGGGAPSASVKAALAGLPPQYADADLANGKGQFSLCRSCHTAVKDGPNMTGPNLYGVFGRAVASRPGYAFSDALKAKGGVWDAASLDQWITDPKAYAPGTKMSFVGLKDPKDRRDTIAYLKVVSSGGAE